MMVHIFNMFQKLNKDVEMKDDFGTLVYEIKKLYDMVTFEYKEGTQ